MRVSEELKRRLVNVYEGSIDIKPYCYASDYGDVTEEFLYDYYLDHPEISGDNPKIKAGHLDRTDLSKIIESLLAVNPIHVIRVLQFPYKSYTLIVKIIWVHNTLLAYPVYDCEDDEFGFGYCQPALRFIPVREVEDKWFTKRYIDDVLEDHV
jgi:hypothetical protein